MGKREKKINGLVGKTFRQASLKRELEKALPDTLWDWYPCEGGLVLGTTFGSRDWHITLKKSDTDRKSYTVSAVSFSDSREEVTL